MQKLYIGIDIGGTSIKFGLFDNNKLLKLWNIETKLYKNSAEKLLIKDIAQSIHCELDKNQLKKLTAVGIGLPGRIINDTIVKSAVNINFKKSFDINKEFNKYFDKKISVIAKNDANVAAYGEYVYSIKKKVNSLCLITIGTGIGGGIIVDKKIVDGFNGSGGEIGHIIIDNDNKFSCNCGNIGCIETICSANGIERVYKQLANINENEHVSTKDIFKKSKEGDILSKKAVDIAINCLAKTITTIQRIIDPEIFIIGGGVSNEGKHLIDLLNNELKQQNKTYCFNNPKLVLAKLKNKAGIFGAYALASGK